MRQPSNPPMLREAQRPDAERWEWRRAKTQRGMRRWNEGLPVHAQPDCPRMENIFLQNHKDYEIFINSRDGIT